MSDGEVASAEDFEACRTEDGNYAPPSDWSFRSKDPRYEILGPAPATVAPATPAPMTGRRQARARTPRPTVARARRGATRTRGSPARRDRPRRRADDDDVAPPGGAA